MNNKETFVETLVVCGEAKYEMSEVHNRILNRIKNLYAIVFKRDKKDFVSLKNMMYFKGGVASPDARPKLHEELDKFIKLANHYDFLGDDELKKYLEENGITISVTVPQFEDVPLALDKKEEKEFEKTWKFTMNNIAVPATTKGILNELIDRSIEVQKSIEDKKEQIEHGAEQVDAECQVKKPYFMKALGIKVQELRNKSVDNELKKIEDSIEASQEVINIFDANSVGKDHAEELNDKAIKEMDEEVTSRISNSQKDEEDESDSE